MFLRSGPDRATLRHLERFESCVRQRFGLPAETLVLVRQEATRQPGLPPQVTVVRFRDAAGRAIRWQAFQPVCELSEADLPPAYLISSYLDDGSDCC